MQYKDFYKLCEKNDINNTQMAKILGVSRQTIINMKDKYDYENISKDDMNYINYVFKDILEGSNKSRTDMIQRIEDIQMIRNFDSFVGTNETNLENKKIIMDIFKLMSTNINDNNKDDFKRLKLIIQNIDRDKIIKYFLRFYSKIKLRENIDNIDNINEREQKAYEILFYRVIKDYTELYNNIEVFDKEYKELEYYIYELKNDRALKKNQLIKDILNDDKFIDGLIKKLNSDSNINNLNVDEFIKYLLDNM